MRAVLFLLVCFTVVRAEAQYLQAVGIPSENLRESVAFQANTQWCWAAAIEMVLDYHGVEISQEEIVRRSYGSDPYGNLPNWPGSFEIITANLNYSSVDENGKRYRVTSYYGRGAPQPPRLLIDELSLQQPIIIGYNTGFSGHAVVVTAATYYDDYFYGPIIQSIIVRDPWPDTIGQITGGRKEYPAYDLAQRMMAYWFVDVEILDEALWYDGALQLAAGWRYLDWLGFFYMTSGGWMYHYDLGWTYPLPGGNNSLYIYDTEDGWLWAPNPAYRWLYSFSLNTWVRFNYAVH